MDGLFILAILAVHDKREVISKLKITSTVSPFPCTRPRTGTHTKSMVFPPSIEAYSVDGMEEKKKRTGNVTTTSEVELQPKTRDRKASRNSWADIYNENTTLRKHKRLLGQEVEADDGLEWRVKWGQRGAGIVCFACVDMLGCKTTYCYYCICCSYVIFAVILYYKNVSFVIAKLLLRETNVVIILILTLCNWSY